MKKTSLVIALFIAIGAFAQKRGQEKKDNFTPEQKTQLMVMKMSLELDLSEKQEAKITPIVAEKVNKMEERKAKFKNRKKGERPERKEISSEEKFKMAMAHLEAQKDLQNKMRNILDDDQYAQWKKIQKKHGERRAKMAMKKHSKKKGEGKRKRDRRPERSEA